MSTTYSKEQVQQEAQAAAQRGEDLNTACPYPFDSQAGLHFAACHALAWPSAAQDNTKDLSP